MGDNLKIGATVDIGGIDEGFTTVQDLTQKTTQRLAIAFEECSARTKAAMRGISDDVKAAAGTASAESIKVAEATKMQSAAMADLRRAQIVAKDANVDEATSTSLLAAAQHGATIATAELTAAREAEAAATAHAAEEVGLSSNSIAAGFQRAGAAVSESLAGMRERLILTGETAHISARDMTSAFSGLGELMGVGLLAGFAGHFLDDIAKLNVEFSHLGEVTGIDAAHLAGLHQIVKEAGVDWEPVATGLGLFNKNMAEANLAMPEMVYALNAIGLTTADLSQKNQTAEEKLNLVAAAFRNTANVENVAYAAKELFGRAGLELIPILKAEGDQLGANAARMAALIGATDDSIAASERWHANVEELTRGFERFGNFAIPHVEIAVRLLAGDFEAAAAVIVDSFTVALMGLASVGEGIEDLGKLLVDATTGNFKAIASDAEAMRDRMVNEWKAGLSSMARGWKEVAELWSKPAEISLPKLTGGQDMKNPNAGTMAVKADVAALNALKVQHRVTLQEEIEFWQEKLAVAEEGTQEYAEIQAKLAPLMQREGKSGGGKNPERAIAREHLQADEDELSAAKLDHQVGIAEEIRFWEQKLAAARKGSLEYRELTAKLAPLEQRQDRQKPTAQPQTQQDNQGIKLAEQEWIASEQAKVRASEAAAREEITAARDADDEEIRAARDKYQDVEQESAEELRLKQITGQQRIAILKNALQQEYQAELAAVQAKQALDLSEAGRYQQDLNKELEMTRQHTRQITQLNQQAAQQSMEQWQKLFNGMTTQMNKVLLDMLNGHQRLAQQLAKVWDGIATNFAQNVLKMTEQFLIGLALQKTGQKSVILGDAKTAAANTYAAVSAIPVVGPFLAPPAAAAAFASVLAFESFDKGGVVTAGGGMHVPVLAKAGERVLTPMQNQNFESLVNHGSQSSSQSSSSVHLHYNGQVNAFDRNGMRSALRAHADDILAVVREGLQTGALAR